MDDGDGCGGQFFVLLEERALCSSNDSWLRSGTAPAGAPLSDQQQGKEGDGQRDAAGHIDAQHASCDGGPGGRSIAPRSTREPSYYDEFDPLSGQTRDRLFFLDRLQEDRRPGVGRMDGVARRARRLAARHASGASRSRGRRDRRTFEAAEAELLQPGERPARGARARGPGAPDTEAAAHPRRPVSEPPTALKQAASESTLPRDEPIGPPTCSAPWASASVSDAVEQIRPPASRCARPARVHQCQAARPLAPIQCCRRVTQPISSRDGVS